MLISRALLLGTLCSALSACDDSFAGLVSRTAPEQVQLADGMIVAGADGWCVDRGASRAGDESAVVVLGNCSALGAGDGDAGVDGLLTVSVDSDGSVPPSLATLESFFDTEAGRAALARDGAADSVEILDVGRSNDALILHATDQSAAPGIAPEYWRALFDLEGRFVSVSLFGVAEAPIDPEDGRATLTAQVASLRAVN